MLTVTCYFPIVSRSEREGDPEKVVLLTGRKERGKLHAKALHGEGQAPRENPEEAFGHSRTAWRTAPKQL